MRRGFLVLAAVLLHCRKLGVVHGIDIDIGIGIGIDIGIGHRVSDIGSSLHTGDGIKTAVSAVSQLLGGIGIAIVL